MKKRGIGFASAWQGLNYHFGAADQSTVQVEITEDLRLRIKVAAADIGQGSTETVCLIVSEVFGGFPLDQIDFVDPDTAVTPDGGATGASRFTEVLGSAALKAARLLTDTLGIVASEMLDSPLEEVVIHGHTFHGRGEKSISLLEVVEACKHMGLALSKTASHEPPPTEALDEKGQGYGVNQYAYATYIAEVEVDTDTGEVEVIRISTFIDAGNIIHPKGAEMQVDGGIVMGLGHALTEEFVQEKGRVETDDLATYLIPSVYDIPSEITYSFVGKPVPSNELGAKGMAELTMVPVIPAIINAIHDAVGIRVTELPATPESILLSMQAIEDTLET
jgi:CO/xanthine dehydrogenase Mo-binding subunit